VTNSPIDQLHVGTQAKLAGPDPRRWWTVRAASGRYAVLTTQAPLRPRGELWYTIADLERGRRGPCNLVGQGWDLTNNPDVGCAALLDALVADEVEISHRNNVPLEVIQHRTVTKMGAPK